MFKKKQKNDGNWKTSGSFIRKPAKGWIHPDHLIITSTVVYETQFIGSVKVLESVKSIPFEQRGLLVREAISRCCAASNLYDLKKRKKCEDPEIIKRLGDINLNHSGSSTSTTFSKSFIRTYILRSGENILNHAIQQISFASIGENEYKSFIGYISKDPELERACFVFDCKGDIADDIILTIGQAFELKYKEFLNSSSAIQPVVKRFTDIDPEPSCSTSKPNGSIVSQDQPDYAALFTEEAKPVIESGPGYDSLQRNDNLPRYASAAVPEEARINFSPCSLYDGKDSEFGAIYDNPISDLTNDVPKKQYNGDVVDIQEDGEDYLEPLPSPTVKTSSKAPAPSLYSQLDTDQSSNSIINLIDTLSDSYTGLSTTTLQDAWFHGKISRVIAEQYIKSDGDFLVRESTSSEGQFVLSGMRNGAHRHILLIDPDGKVRTKDHTFSDVPELITYHYKKDLPIYSGTSEIYLKKEIPRASLK